MTRLRRLLVVIALFARGWTNGDPDFRAGNDADLVNIWIRVVRGNYTNTM